MGNTYHKRGEMVHGFAVSDHPLYVTWANMKARCDRRNSEGYENYGGRGIRYCERWKDFKNFAIDMGLKPTPEHTLERLDVNADYCPENCTWATRGEQCVNRRLFKNNSTGFVGVVSSIGGRYKARFERDNVRYLVGGTYKTPQEAAEKRAEVLGLFAVDREAALRMCERQVRSDSTTGVKGVSRHKDGRGFTARVTSADKKRIYLGYFTSIDSATNAIEHYKRTGQKVEKENKTWKRKSN